MYFGGEACTTLPLTKEFLAQIVELGFQRSGYVPELRNFFTKKEVMLASDMKIVNKICAQSPDIAQGTTDKGEESGWNDQGVYFSSAENTTPNRQGTAMYLATLVGEALQKDSLRSVRAGLTYYDEPIVLGPDNKCVITVKVAEDGFTPLSVTAITIAVAHSADTDPDILRAYVKQRVATLIRLRGYRIAEGCEWVINGTGRFVIHGCVSDTSMTGRKISVNHPSAGPVWANKMIGGGSLVKPAHASDLMLNLMSRYIANIIVESGLSSYAIVGCAGAIGVQGLQSIFIKGDDEFEKTINKAALYSFFASFIKWSPIAIANKFRFFATAPSVKSIDFGEVVDQNFFGHADCQPWENKAEMQQDIDALLVYLNLV